MKSTAGSQVNPYRIKQTGGSESFKDRPVLEVDGIIPSRLSPRLVRLKQAARYLNLSPWQVRRFVHDGLLPVIQYSKPRGTFFFDLRDLDSFIEKVKARLT